MPETLNSTHNNSKPLVSIITPNYNSSSYIAETHDSIQQQTHPNWEWLIIDDGSDDDSSEIIKQFSSSDPRIKIFERKNPPKGASTCRNIGIEQARGKYLMFLDADDLLAPFCLEQRVKKVSIQPELDFGVFKMGFFKKNLGDSPGCINIYTETKAEYLHFFLSYNLPWAITCPFWKREFLTENNILFSEKYPRLQDPEFHTKILLKHNPKFEVFSKAKIDCYYRQGSNHKIVITPESLNKSTKAIALFYKDISAAINKKDRTLDGFLDKYVLNVFHSLLFNHRLQSLKQVIHLFRQMNSCRTITNLSIAKILLFFFLNRSRLTFVKGAGVSLLWKILVLKPNKL
ncbi:glycosyltransferase family 2 protein [Anaerophaga thermohalophila]|uniref:glycosyltransferase family 2 protein n=1 Tax=Anaerophaga thermohalophila TaxID=177400 RepID=UPI00030234DA|nr:glycosyltransferase family A protein [Anaerophaga thermohalophila]